ncbi:MAG: cystathionine beta-lyase [bacterium]
MTDAERPVPRLHVDTLLAHLGGDAASRHGAVSPPVYRASTILFPTVAEWEASRDPALRFDLVRYGQLGTPTTFALEQAIAAVEGGYRAMLLPSGLAAVTVALQALLSAGDHLLMVDSAYTPTRHFCTKHLARAGVTTTFYDPLVGGDIRTLFRENTRVVFVESPGSLTFEVQDVPAISEAAHVAGIVVVADNTWASPYFFSAFRHGVDVSIQAATKFIAGHSDVMMGSITTTEALYDRVRSAVAEFGYCVSPDDAYLVMRGMRTLAVRMERHEKSGRRVAEWLASRPEVARVVYPVLEGDPGHALWRRDYSGASGVFGVVLAPMTKRAVDALLDSLQLFGMGASFGGFESLVIPAHPGASRSATTWRADGPYLRLHIGLEDPDDLIADLARGFDTMRTTGESSE